MIVNFIISILIAYFLGSIPTGLWIAKMLKGIDIRTVGSGSTGGTNVTRVLGTTWGVTVIVIDAIKGILAVLVANLLLNSYPNSNLYIVIASIFSIIGHIWTVFANFKGGKGIATSLGVLLALLTTETLVALLIFIIIFAIFRIVSVGSLTAAVSLIITVFVRYNYFNAYNYNDYLINLTLVVLLNIIVFYTHRQNIQRLLKGEEKKLELKKKV